MKAFPGCANLDKRKQSYGYHADMKNLQELAELPAMERSAALRTWPPDQPAARVVFREVLAHAGEKHLDQRYQCAGKRCRE